MLFMSASTTVHNFDKIWEALVILCDVRNSYTVARNINQKIDQITEGNLDALFGSMNIDEKNSYKR